MYICKYADAYAEATLYEWRHGTVFLTM